MSTNLKPMPQQRHDAIRSMLVEHVSTHAHSHIDAAPSWRRPTLIGVAAASMITAGITTAIVIADPTAPPSYASWTATPDPSIDEAEALGEWRSRCTDLGTGGIGFVDVPVPEWSPRDVLVDRRGDFVFCVDITLGKGTPASPFIGLAGIRADKGLDSLNTMHAVVHDKQVAEPKSDEVLIIGSAEVKPDPNPSIQMLSASEIYGLAGPEVIGVDIHLANGTTVTASVNNGLFGAWWPTTKGSIEGATLTIHTRNADKTVDAISSLN